MLVIKTPKLPNLAWAKKFINITTILQKENFFKIQNVIRNQFVVDEGDPFNEILVNKSINNIKSLGYFKSVEKEVINLENTKTKIINVSVTEKPTGELFAVAGIGTTGNSIGFGELGYLAAEAAGSSDCHGGLGGY